MKYGRMLGRLLEVTRTVVVTGVLVFLPVRPGGLAAAPEAGEFPVVPLWSDGAPGFESKKDLSETVVNGNLASIHNPSLTVFLPELGHETGAGVIILPGGGHRFLVMEKEGTTVAKWLAAHGIAALVLKYRLSREAGSTYRIEVEALQDAQRAVRLVRSRATEWKIDPARVGVLGFSAGGELAALVSMRYDGGVANASDPVDRRSCKPAFQALIYPGASQNIIPTKESPPAFLAAGIDDRPDISEGVARAYLLFKQVAVPAELHIYAGTGHGFGLRPGPSAGWIARFSEWLAERTVSLPR